MTDARGHRFRNTFYDTGDLRTTQQPTFWKLAAGENGEFSLGERSAKEMAEMASGRDLPTGEGHGDLGRVDQQDKPELLPKAGTPELVYDDEMRLTGINQAATERNTDGTATQYDSKIEIGRDPLGRVKRMAWPHDVRGDDGVAGNGHIGERYGYDRNGNRISFRSGTVAAIDGGGGVETTVAYDGYDREIKQTLPPTSDGGAGRVFTQEHDANGNTISRTTPARGGATWRTAFDALDRPIGSQSPVRRTRGGQTTTETTCVGYDEAGNAVWERGPRGNLPGVPGRPGSGTALADLCPQGEQPPGSPSTAGCDTDDTPAAECFTTRRWFNAAGELVKERDGHGHVSTFRYDPNGNQVREEQPGARASADGSVNREVTCREYDGRDLPWTETTGVPEATGCDSAGGADGERTAVTEYDGNGNLIRQVNPAGVGATRRPGTALGTDMTPDSDKAKNATVYRYSTANQIQARLLPWDDEDDGTRWRQNYDLDARGRVERIAGPYKQGLSELTQITEYERYETGWIRRSKEEADDPNLADEQNDPKAARGQVVSYEYDGRGNQTLWRSQIRKDGDDVEKRRVERTYFQSDNLEKRTASAPGDTTRTYTYAYDANGQMTTMRDAQNDHTTHFSYDLADRSTRVNECWEKGDDTRTTYDEAGEVETRMTDGRYAGGTCSDPSNFTDGKTSTFTRDSLGHEVRTVIDPEGSQSNRRFDTTFWPSGEVRTRVKKRASGSDWAETVTESKYYERAGRLGLRVRDPQTGDTDTIDYQYDKNGNRTKDERGTHSFNARDQLVRWDRKSGDTHVTYGVNGAGAITSKNDTKDGSSMTYKTIGDRIDSLTVSQSGVSATYKYEHDDLGNVVKVFDTERPSDTKSTVTYDYDPFNRLLGSKGEGVGGESSYTYDALDRRDTETKGSQRFDLSYVGMSESLSQREGLATSSDGTDTANGTKRFDYDSEMTRLGMTSTDQQGATKYRSYATDANGSVVGLESDQDGSVADKDKYDYDPYGQLEKKESTGGGPVTPEEQEEQTRSSIRQLAGVERNTAEDDLSPDAQENPFRYEGHYANSDGTYDMQARAYRPAIGRFLSEDRFEAASGDFSLQADPLTQNRYAFAGGNPINNIEFDGHEPSSSFTNGCDSMYGSRSRCLQEKNGRRRLAQARRSAARAQRGAAKSGVQLSTPRWLQSKAQQRAAFRARAVNTANRLFAEATAPPKPREDKGFVDYLANDFGGDSKALIGTDFGVGDPNSETYQKGYKFYSQPAAQVGSFFVPGLGVLKVGKGWNAVKGFGRMAKTAGRHPRLAVRAARVRFGYERAVPRLKGEGEKLLAQGVPEQDVAMRLNAARRELGRKLKADTPEPFHGQMYERNRRLYGDELGPTYEWFKARKATDRQIIESSARTGGPLWFLK